MKSAAILWLFFLAIYLGCNNLFAQQSQIQFQHLTVEDGLSDNNINAIIQDRYGFIWIATLDGLNRFDGYRVEIFSHQINEPSSLPSDRINCLYADAKGNLWIGTDDGLSKFNYNSHSFTNFKHTAEKNSLPSSNIRRITGDSYGCVWIATNQGLCCFNQDKKIFTTYLPQVSDSSITNKNIIDFAKDNNNNLWLLTSQAIIKFNLHAQHFTAWHYTDTSESSRGSIAVDHHNKIWFCVDEEVGCFNPALQKIEHVFKFNAKPTGHTVFYLRNIFVDKSGKIWLAAQPLGCGYLTNENDSFHFIKHSILLNTSLGANGVRCIFEDRDGLMYLGSDNGVDRFNPVEKKFDLYRSFDASVPRQWFRVFSEDDKKNLWIATGSSGVYVLNRKTNSVLNYCNVQGKDNSLSENSVRSFCLDKHGVMWVGTAHGLNRFDKNTQTFTTYLPTNTNNNLPGDFIWNIVNDDKGNLWITTNHGLCYYDYTKKTFSNFLSDSSKQVLNRSINSIYIDRNKNLWLGINLSAMPLVCYNPSTNKIMSWKYNSEDTAAISGNSIYSIIQDNKDDIWLGTSGGLCRYNKLKNNFTTFTVKNGLPNNHVAQLIFDDHRNLWMSTNNGICMMNATATAFKTFDESDGLQGKEFNLQSAYKTYDGKFCFGGYDGFNMFDPDSFQYNIKPPPVVIRSVKIFDKYLNKDSSIFSLQPMRFSYSENFFTFEFAALNYDHPEKNQYECQLIGFDKKMILLGNNRTVSYTNVPPGKYTLKVIASNNNDVWNEKGIEWSIIITPPFWETWWFYLLCFIVLAGSLYMFYRMRINQLKRELFLRTKIARDLHDDVGSTLSSLHMVSALAEKKINEDLNKTKELLEKITESSERMTGNMQDIVWAVNPTNDSFSEIIARMQKFAAQMLEAKNIELFFEADEKIKSLKVPLQYRGDLFMIFKEAINNLAKYSNANHAYISLYKNNKNFMLEIKDDGVGFNINEISFGNGLRNMEQRAKNINAKLEIISGKNAGTKIILKFEI